MPVYIALHARPDAEYFQERGDGGLIKKLTLLK